MGLLNFILSKLRKPFYRVEGSCLKCGSCCRLIYSLDDYTVIDFKITQFIYPAYKRFEVIGKDKDGNLMLRCKLIKEDNTCSEYDKRLRMCKKFPNTHYGSMGNLPANCGYKLVPVKEFSEYLN